MTTQTTNLERGADGSPGDDTETNVRAYFATRSDDHLRQYRSDWSDEDVIKWDGNFRNDGALMIVCCFRDVEVGEYRKILEDHLKQRGIST